MNKTDRKRWINKQIQIDETQKKRRKGRVRQKKAKEKSENKKYRTNGKKKRHMIGRQASRKIDKQADEYITYFQLLAQRKPGRSIIKENGNVSPSEINIYS